MKKHKNTAQNSAIRNRKNSGSNLGSPSLPFSTREKSHKAMYSDNQSVSEFNIGVPHHDNSELKQRAEEIQKQHQNPQKDLETRSNAPHSNRQNTADTLSNLYKSELEQIAQKLQFKN